MSKRSMKPSASLNQSSRNGSRRKIAPELPRSVRALSFRHSGVSRATIGSWVMAMREVSPKTLVVSSDMLPLVKKAYDVLVESEETPGGVYCHKRALSLLQSVWSRVPETVFRVVVRQLSGGRVTARASGDDVLRIGERNGIGNGIVDGIQKAFLDAPLPTKPVQFPSSVDASPKEILRLQKEVVSAQEDALRVPSPPSLHGLPLEPSVGPLSKPKPAVRFPRSVVGVGAEEILRLQEEVVSAQKKALRVPSFSRVSELVDSLVSSGNGSGDGSGDVFMVGHVGSSTSSGVCSTEIEMRWAWVSELSSPGSAVESMLEGRPVDGSNVSPALSQLLAPVRDSSRLDGCLVWHQEGPSKASCRADSRLSGVFSSGDVGPLLNERGGSSRWRNGPSSRDFGISLSRVRGPGALPRGITSPIKGSGMWTDEEHDGRACLEFGLRGYLTRDGWLLLLRSQRRLASGGWEWVPFPGTDADVVRRANLSGFERWRSRLHEVEDAGSGKGAQDVCYIGVLSPQPASSTKGGRPPVPVGARVLRECSFAARMSVADDTLTEFGFCDARDIGTGEDVSRKHVKRLIFRASSAGVLQAEMGGRSSVLVFRASAPRYSRVEEASRILLAGETDGGESEGGTSVLNGVYQADTLEGVAYLRAVTGERGDEGERLYVYTLEGDGRGGRVSEALRNGAVRWESPPPPSGLSLRLDARARARALEGGSGSGQFVSLRLEPGSSPPLELDTLDLEGAPPTSLLPRPPPVEGLVYVSGLEGAEYDAFLSVVSVYRQVSLWFLPEEGGGYLATGTGYRLFPGFAEAVVLSGSCLPAAPPENLSDYVVSLCVRVHARYRRPSSPKAPWSLVGEPSWGGSSSSSSVLLPPPLPEWATRKLKDRKSCVEVLAEDAGERRGFLIVPHADAHDVLLKVYNDPQTGGMAGLAAMRMALRERYIGITGRAIRSFLEEQALRNVRKAPTLLVEKPLRPRGINHWWQLDFVVLNAREEADEGGLFKYVLVVTDIFSRYLWTFPVATRTQISLDGPFESLVDNLGVLPCSVTREDNRRVRQNCRHTLVPYLEWLFLTEGTPEILQGDREFNSNAMIQLCKRYSVELRTSKAVTPQTNGKVERINRSFKSLLRAYQLEQRNSSWIQRLMQLTARYNNTVHSATGQPPIFVYKGKKPRVHARLRGLDTFRSAESAREERLAARFPASERFVDLIPPEAQFQYGYEAVLEGLGAPVLRGELLGEVRRFVSERDAVHGRVRAYNDWSADKMLCRAMERHPEAVLKVGALVRARTRKNRGFKGVQGHWSRELYMVIAVEESRRVAGKETEASLPGLPSALPPVRVTRRESAVSLAASALGLSREETGDASKVELAYQKALSAPGADASALRGHREALLSRAHGSLSGGERRGVYVGDNLGPPVPPVARLLWVMEASEDPDVRVCRARELVRRWESRSRGLVGGAEGGEPPSPAYPVVSCPVLSCRYTLVHILSGTVLSSSWLRSQVQRNPLESDLHNLSSDNPAGEFLRTSARWSSPSASGFPTDGLSLGLGGGAVFLALARAIASNHPCRLGLRPLWVRRPSPPGLPAALVDAVRETSRARLALEERLQDSYRLNPDPPAPYYIKSWPALARANALNTRRLDRSASAGAAAFVRWASAWARGDRPPSYSGAPHLLSGGGRSMSSVWREERAKSVWAPPAAPPTSKELFAEVTRSSLEDAREALLGAVSSSRRGKPFGKKKQEELFSLVSPPGRELREEDRSRVLEFARGLQEDAWLDSRIRSGREASLKVLTGKGRGLSEEEKSGVLSAVAAGVALTDAQRDRVFRAARRWKEGVRLDARSAAEEEARVQEALLRGEAEKLEESVSRGRALLSQMRESPEFGGSASDVASALEAREGELRAARKGLASVSKKRVESLPVMDLGWSGLPKDEVYGEGWMVGALWLDTGAEATDATSGRWVWRGSWSGQGSSRALLSERLDTRLLEQASIDLQAFDADRLHDREGALEAYTHGVTPASEPRAALREQRDRRRRRVLSQHVLPFACVSSSAAPSSGGLPPSVPSGLSVELVGVLFHCDPSTVTQDGWPPGTESRGDSRTNRYLGADMDHCEEMFSGLRMNGRRNTGAAFESLSLKFSKRDAGRLMRVWGECLGYCGGGSRVRLRLEGSFDPRDGTLAVRRTLGRGGSVDEAAVEDEYLAAWRREARHTDEGVGDGASDGVREDEGGGGDVGAEAKESGETAAPSRPRRGVKPTGGRLVRADVLGEGGGESFRTVVGVFLTQDVFWSLFDQGSGVSAPSELPSSRVRSFMLMEGGELSGDLFPSPPTESPHEGQWSRGPLWSSADEVRDFCRSFFRSNRHTADLVLGSRVRTPSVDGVVVGVTPARRQGAYIHGQARLRNEAEVEVMSATGQVSSVSSSEEALELDYQRGQRFRVSGESEVVSGYARLHGPVSASSWSWRGVWVPVLSSGRAPPEGVRGLGCRHPVGEYVLYYSGKEWRAARVLWRREATSPDPLLASYTLLDLGVGTGGGEEREESVVEGVSATRIRSSAPPSSPSEPAQRADSLLRHVVLPGSRVGKLAVSSSESAGFVAVGRRKKGELSSLESVSALGPVDSLFGLRVFGPVCGGDTRVSGYERGGGVVLRSLESGPRQVSRPEAYEMAWRTLMAAGHPRVLKGPGFRRGTVAPSPGVRGVVAKAHPGSPLVDVELAGGAVVERVTLYGGCDPRLCVRRRFQPNSRVLTPGGRLAFLEPGSPPQPQVRFKQSRNSRPTTVAAVLDPLERGTRVWVLSSAGGGYVGRRVSKRFDDGEAYGGVVESEDKEAETGKPLFHIVYDDGDTEDVYEDELEQVLVPEKKGADLVRWLRGRVAEEPSDGEVRVELEGKEGQPKPFSLLRVIAALEEGAEVVAPAFLFPDAALTVRYMGGETDTVTRGMFVSGRSDLLFAKGLAGEAFVDNDGSEWEVSSPFRFEEPTSRAVSSDGKSFREYRVEDLYTLADRSRLRKKSSWAVVGGEVRPARLDRDQPPGHRYSVRAGSDRRSVWPWEVL